MRTREPRRPGRKRRTTGSKRVEVFQLARRKGLAEQVAQFRLDRLEPLCTPGGGIEHADGGLVAVDGEHAAPVRERQGESPDAAEQIGHALGSADGIHDKPTDFQLRCFRRLNKNAGRWHDIDTAEGQSGRSVFD